MTILYERRFQQVDLNNELLDEPVNLSENEQYQQDVGPQYKVSAIIGALLVSPTIIIHSAGLITGSLLIPLRLCHPFDGNGHGSNPLCWIGDFGYIFGIVASYGTFAIPTLAGIFLLVWHATRVRLHNRRNPEAPLKVHRIASVALVALVLLSQSLSICALAMLPLYFLSVFVRNLCAKQSTQISYSRPAIVLFLLALILQFPAFYQIYRFHEKTGYWSPRRYYLEKKLNDSIMDDTR